MHQGSPQYLFLPLHFHGVCSAAELKQKLLWLSFVVDHLKSLTQHRLWNGHVSQQVALFFLSFTRELGQEILKQSHIPLTHTS